METAETDDDPLSPSHTKSSSVKLAKIHPVLLQSLQQAELDLILQELEELIESEGGVVIP
jgi:hypothetical protein